MSGWKLQIKPSHLMWTKLGPARIKREDRAISLFLPQARPEPGPGQIFGNLGTCKSGILESQTIIKIRFLKFKIRSAQNVGKVWISRTKLMTTFQVIPSCFHGPHRLRKYRVRPAAAFANLEIWKSGNLESWELGIQQHPQNENYPNQNPFRPKCRRGPD